MSLQPWALAPVWTTVADLRVTQPPIWEAARHRVAPDEPVDLDAAATAFLEAAIIRAQGDILPTILTLVDGPEAVATTVEETPADLFLHTTRRAIVEVYLYDLGRGLPPSIQAIADQVETWKASLRSGHGFLAHPTPGEEELRRVPVRRVSRGGSPAASGLGARAAELLR